MELRTTEQREKYYNYCMSTYETWCVEGCERLLNKLVAKANKETFEEVQAQALTDTLILKGC